MRGARHRPGCSYFEILSLTPTRATSLRMTVGMTMALLPLDDVRFHYREDALQRGINPRDVDLLLGDLLGQPLSWLIAFGETPVDPAPLEALLARRYSGEPLQYIRKRTEFYSREFYVDDRV